MARAEHGERSRGPAVDELRVLSRILVLFFFNSTTTPEIYTLSLHDALPISLANLVRLRALVAGEAQQRRLPALALGPQDRKSTRLNSSHVAISYAVFCLKKKTRCCARCTSCATGARARWIARRSTCSATARL